MASSFWPPKLLSQQLPNFETQWHISACDWVQLLHICSGLSCLTLPLFVSVALCPGSRVTLLFLTSLHTCPHYDFNHISGTGPLPAHGFRSVPSSRARCPEPHSRLMDTAGCAHTHSLRSVPGSAMVLSWTFLSKIFLRTPQAEFVPRLNISPLQIWGSPCLLDNRLLMSIKNPSSQTSPDTSHLPFLGPYCNLMGHTSYFLQSCDFWG